MNSSGVLFFFFFVYFRYYFSVGFIFIDVFVDLTWRTRSLESRATQKFPFFSLFVRNETFFFKKKIFTLTLALWRRQRRRRLRGRTSKNFQVNAFMRDRCRFVKSIFFFSFISLSYKDYWPQISIFFYFVTFLPKKKKNLFIFLF